MAAEKGYLELLRWALKNGCPYNQEDFEAITDPDFLKWLEWLEQEEGSMK
eukprot:CAMPEP_0194313738 /NCGR_PEP_ID=MMETSP0171-20130528/10595_1 /TAXON_ID=218684 /ORGANISM="Corethron pennatum, Strain L29A3" /LENGTH=49 /DNA_ID=CAMNT_0039068829 /DNA_START=29 /DNA_END=178 /DNA_ORIENTATION=-